MWVDTGNTRRYTHDIEQLRLDALYLEDFKNQHQYDLFAEKRMILDKLQEEGFFSVQDGHASPTPTDLAVADSLSLI